MAGGAVHRTPYQECLNLAEWGRAHGSYLAARAAVTGQDYHQGGARWCFDFVFGCFVEVCLMDEAEQRMKMIDKITELIGQKHTADVSEQPGMRAVNE